MKETITNYVKGCAICQSCKNNPTNPKPPLFPIAIRHYNPFESVSLDFIVKLPLSNSYNTILTITDHNCSKASILIPCNETIDAERTTLLYATYAIPHFGLPKLVISDYGPQFRANFTRDLCKHLHIDQNISTAYNPQTNGQSERTNQRVEQYLCIQCNYQQNNWALWLPLCYNWTPISLLFTFCLFTYMSCDHHVITSMTIVQVTCCPCDLLSR